MTEFGAGVLLGLRRWRTVTALALMMTIACGVMALLLGDVLTQTAVLRGGSTLREQRATVFTTFYGSTQVNEVRGPTLTAMGSLMDDRRAYTAIINNVQVNNPDFADGVPTIVLFGDLVADLYPDLELCSPAPCAMRGSDVSHGPPPSLDIAGDELAPDAVLPQGATLFDPNAAGLNLDDKIVIRLPSDRLPALDELEREEAATRMVTVAANERDLAEFVDPAAKDGLYLVPQDVSVAQPQRFREIMIMSGVYVLGMAAFVALVLVAFALTAERTLHGERPSFVIRRMYGASASMVWLRTSGFLFTVLIAFPVPLLLLLAAIGPPIRVGAVSILVGLLAVFAALLMRTVYSVTEFDRRTGGVVES